MSIWFEKKVIPQRFVYHISKIEHRKSIEDNGLLPFACADTNNWKFKDEANYPALIFANNTTDFFDFFYFESRFHYLAFKNFEVWEIDTNKIKNDWYIDLNLFKTDRHVCTPQPIPREVIKMHKIAKVFCPYCEDIDFGRSFDVMLSKGGEYGGMWCNSCEPEDDLYYLEKYYDERHIFKK